MKKPIIIVILILLTIIGCFSVIYATGNFDKIVDKVFLRDEVEEDAEEEKEEKILTIEEKRDNQRISDLQIISDALNEYANQNKKTENPYLISNGLEKISDESCILHKVFKETMSEIPIDPKGPEFWYGYRSDGKTYELTAVLENKNNAECEIEGNLCIYRVYRIKKAEVSIKNPEVDNWKIYQNEEYGFEIKYPINWEYKKKYIPDYPQTNERLILSFGEPHMESVLIWIDSSNNGFKDYFKDFFDLTNQECSKIFLSNREVRMCERDPLPLLSVPEGSVIPPDMPMVESKWIEVKNKENFYFICAGNIISVGDNFEIFEKILSSFRFLE